MFSWTWMLLCVLCSFSPANETAYRSSIPEYLSDWIKTSPPKSESDAWFAANYSEYEWQVGMKNGRPVAHRKNRELEEKAALPPALKHDDGKQDERGEVHTYQVNSGWLVAYYAGEWGGSLWWYTPDG